MLRLVRRLLLGYLVIGLLYATYVHAWVAVSNPNRGLVSFTVYTAAWPLLLAGKLHSDYVWSKRTPIQG